MNTELRKSALHRPAHVALIVAASLAWLVPAARADVTISSKPTQNMSCSGGVCTATAKKAALNVGDLATMLAGGDVTVASGSLAVNIDIEAALSWTSTNRLTLDANQSVSVKKPVTVAGTGALTITTNDGGTGGDLQFLDRGSATFWGLSSSLVINGGSYALVGDIATLASDIATNPSGLYALANRYDAKHDRFQKVPIPTEFSGTFEGLGQTIANLHLKHQESQVEGLFGQISANGTVRDLVLTKVELSTPDTSYAGALVGRNFGTVANVAVDGIAMGGALDLGGIVGANNGTIANASAAVTVSSIAGGSAGGIAGTSDGTIIRSRSTGAISGGVAGGLVGGGSSSITLCYATGTVTGVVIGGLAGISGPISQSFATGSVSTNKDVGAAGGLVGNGINITNSYSTGQVSAGHKTDTGGLVGFGETISDSYSTGAVTAEGGSSLGGFIGHSRSHHTIQDYWDLDTSGVSQGCGKGDCTGVTGLTDSQLKSELPSGFDPAIWGQNPNINGGLPYLLALRPPN